MLRFGGVARSFPEAGYHHLGTQSHEGPLHVGPNVQCYGQQALQAQGGRLVLSFCDRIGAFIRLLGPSLIKEKKDLFALHDRAQVLKPIT